MKLFKYQKILRPILELSFQFQFNAILFKAIQPISCSAVVCLRQNRNMISGCKLKYLKKQVKYLAERYRIFILHKCKLKHVFFPKKNCILERVMQAKNKTNEFNKFNKTMKRQNEYVCCTVNFLISNYKLNKRERKFLEFTCDMHRYLTIL